MDQFDDNTCEILINEVRLHPCLWERSNTGYKDQKAKEAAWVDIGRNMGIHDVHCKRKWTALRDLFVKSFKTQGAISTANGAGAGSSRRCSTNPKWKFFHHMYFLADNLNPRVITEYNIVSSGDSSSCAVAVAGKSAENPANFLEINRQERCSSLPPAISVKQENDDQVETADSDQDPGDFPIAADVIPLASSPDGETSGATEPLESPPASRPLVRRQIAATESRRSAIQNLCWRYQKQRTIVAATSGDGVAVADAVKRRRDEREDAEFSAGSSKNLSLMTSSSADHDTIYGNYVAATIAKFPRKIKGKVKMRIMEILLRAEEETEEEEISPPAPNDRIRQNGHC